MTTDKTTRQNRVREALGRIYDQQPPYFREYLRRFQEDPTSRVFAPLAEAYRRLGRVDEAIEICREGLEHHPEFHGGRVALAKCLVDKKDYREAREQLERVVRAVPENLLAQRLLGEVNLVLDDKEAALHAFKMALLLAPADVALAEKLHNLERQMLEVKRSPETAVADLGGDDGELELAPEPEAEAPAPGSRALDELLAEGDEGEASSLWSLDEGTALGGPFSPPNASPAPVPEEPDAFLKGLEEEAAEEAVVSSDGAEPLVQLAEDGDIEDLLGAEQGAEEEGFRVEHVSEVFKEGDRAGASQEITTETLGDLYFSQGQYDKALRIFEKLGAGKPSVELNRKINACRARLGVSREALLRNRQVEVLQRVLQRVKSGR